MQTKQNEELLTVKRAKTLVPSIPMLRTAFPWRHYLTSLFTRCWVVRCCDLVLYFCVFSIFGHWMEAAYCTLVRFHIVPGVYDPSYPICSDLLAPYPVYGIGVVVCIVLLHPTKRWLEAHLRGRIMPFVLSFLVNAAVCTLIELLMGLLFNQPDPNGKLCLWDYHTRFANFMGQVCLQNALSFGAVASLITWYVYPALGTALQNVSPLKRYRIFGCIVCVYFALMVCGFMLRG